MRIVPLLVAAASAAMLSGCAVVGAGASVAGSVISTTVDVTGDVVGGVVNTVAGDDDD